MGNDLPNRTAAIASGAFLGSKLVNLQAFANAIRSAATVTVTQEQGVFQFKLTRGVLLGCRAAFRDRDPGKPFSRAL